MQTREEWEEGVGQWASMFEKMGKGEDEKMGKGEDEKRRKGEDGNSVREFPADLLKKG